LQQKILCWKEGGLVTLFVSSVGKEKQFSIFSFLALLLNMCGVVLPNLLVLLPDLGNFPSFSGGSLDMFRPVGMFKSLGLQQSKLRNRSCFEGKLIKSPIELILYATVFMNYWAGLNSVADQENIRRGAGNLINVAQSMQNKGRGSNLRIEPGAANQNSGNVDAGAAQDADAGDEEDASR
jgi:hypothetical protein